MDSEDESQRRPEEERTPNILGARVRGLEDHDAVDATTFVGATSAKAPTASVIDSPPPTLSAKPRSIRSSVLDRPGLLVAGRRPTEGPPDEGARPRDEDRDADDVNYATMLVGAVSAMTPAAGIHQSIVGLLYEAEGCPTTAGSSAPRFDVRPNEDGERLEASHRRQVPQLEADRDF